MASVHGSMDGVGFNSSDFPPLNTKSPTTSANSTASPLTATNLRSDAVYPSVAQRPQHADLKGDSSGDDVQSSWSSLFSSGNAAQL